MSEQRTEWLNVRTTVEEMERWGALAEKWGEPLSAVVRRLLDTAAEQGMGVVKKAEVRGTRSSGGKNEGEGKCEHGETRGRCPVPMCGFYSYAAYLAARGEQGGKKRGKR